MHTVCTRWVCFFKNGGAPTCRALASACSPAPTTQTILNKGSFLLSASLRSSIHKRPHFTANHKLDGLVSGCGSSRPGRSTRRGFQQTARPSHPEGPILAARPLKKVRKPMEPWEGPGLWKTPSQLNVSFFAQVGEISLGESLDFGFRV